MRKAAGIMLITYGAVWLYFAGGRLISESYYLRMPESEPEIPIFLSVVPFALIVSGGVFCLKRRYWGRCLASALLAVLVLIYWLYTYTIFHGWGHSFFMPPLFDGFLGLYLSVLIITGILALIFVCLRKSEWEEVSG